MRGDNNSARPLHPARMLSIVVASLALLASFFPDKRMWGIHHLAFYPRAVLLAAFAVMAASYLPAAGRFVQSLSGRIANMAGGKKTATALTLAVVACLLFLRFDSSTLILGDGQYIANNIENALEADSRTFLGYFTQVDRFYPGTEVLYLTASRFSSSLFGAAPLTGVKILSCIFGVLFVLLLISEIRCSSTPDNVTLVLILLLSGGVVLFFGYVEVYAPVFFFTFLYFFLARRVITKGTKLWAPAVCVLIASLMHVLGLILVPSLCFLFIWAACGRQLSPKLLFACIVIVAATMAVPAVAAHIAGLKRFFLPLAGSGDAYGILSAAHLIDIANELLLLFPGMLVLGTVVIVVVARRIRSSGRGIVQYFSNGTAGTFPLELLFSVMLFMPAAVLLFSVNPELGMARDWDLFAVSLVGLYAPILVVLTHHDADDIIRKTLRPAWPPVLAITLVLTAAWIGINADPARSIARFESILAYDRTNAGYAYENLASHYHTIGDVDAEIRALESAYDTSRNPRYLFTLGLRYYFIEKKERAVKTLQKYLELASEDEHARQSLIQMFYFMDRYEEVHEVCAEGAERAPENPFYPFFQGKAYANQGRIEEALAAFDGCLKLHPSPAMAEEINEFIKAVELRRREEKDSFEP